MDLKIIEEKIKTFYGSTVFDYVFLFGGKETKPIIDCTSEKQKILLQEYIGAVNTFFKESNQPEIVFSDTSTLDKNFWEAMHNLYIFRQMCAQCLFAKYEMIRIDTWVEDKMNILSKGTLPKSTTTFTLDIPGALIRDNLGSIDFDSCLLKEQQTNNIKSCLSAVPSGRQDASYLFTLFCNYTSKEFVPRFFEKEIINLCETIMREIGLFLSKDIYSYLDKKYSLIEAKNNVLNLIYNQLRSNNYFPALINFKAELIKRIIKELSLIKTLDSEVVKIIADEFWAIFSLYFERKIFFPQNYYSLVFRMADSQRKTEEDFRYIIDSSLIEDDGTVWTFPIETYAIELSQDSRIKIYDFISNGFENPLYTLNDYLYIYS